MKKIDLILFIIICIFSIFIIKSFAHKEVRMKITSAFEQNENIPSVYTCDGKDLAPEIIIHNVPATALELVLIVDDPDAPSGTFVHWLVYNISPKTKKIEAMNLPEGAKEGMTDFGKIGWGGPCPPSGTHRYFFKLYALNHKLNLPAGLTKAELENAMNVHVIEKTELIGFYKRL